MRLVVDYAHHSSYLSPIKSVSLAYRFHYLVTQIHLLVAQILILSRSFLVDQSILHA